MIPGDERIVIYRCPNCKSRFVRREPMAESCAVIHPVGTCCHKYEKFITDVAYQELIQAITEGQTCPGPTDSK